MNIFKYDAPCVIAPFDKCNEIKELALFYIAKDIRENSRRLTCYEMDIYSDFGEKDQTYWKLLKNDFYEHQLKVVQAMGYDDVELVNIWYQQYIKGGKHGWHVHMDCSFTTVYYLEYPEGSPATELMDSITKQVISLDSIKEGDTLTFPSYIVHRAPENKTNNRKTIFSWHNNVRWDETK